MSTVILLIIAYLLGSIPFGWLMIKLAGKGDLRKVGSGGTGATNVARVAGLSGFILTWALDMAKTIAAVLLGAHFVSPEFGALMGLVAVIGHCFPVWLKFKGGKGNSSMFGVLLATNPIAFATVGIVWLLVAASSGYSSLGALVGFVVMPFLGFAVSFNMGLIFIAIAALCIFQHRENIKRLMRGTESKMQMNVGKLITALVVAGLILIGVVLVVM